MQRLFEFDTSRYAAEFGAQGYVHIPRGLTPEFHAVLMQQVENYLEYNRLEQFTIGDKRQALYEFPPDADYLEQLFDAVGAVCGLAPSQLVLSERHIKTYDADAKPRPLVHKDRFASEISIGFSVSVPRGSTLVIYPHDDTETNPYNSSTELRRGLPPHRLPEVTLQGARLVEIQDEPRDVVMFRGHSMWHLRNDAAHTTMLYLKLNSFNSDPLGEDPSTASLTQRTQELAGLPDEEFGQLVPLIGRRVDYIQRRYNRKWQEVLSVALWGGPGVAIDEDQWRALHAMDGHRTVKLVVQQMGATSDGVAPADKLRHLASCGVIDLRLAP